MKPTNFYEIQKNASPLHFEVEKGDVNDCDAEVNEGKTL